MRNLLGRLHARPAGDLARIALFWRVPLGDAARPSQVGTLYRAMVDPRAVRSVWDRLDPEAREMVRLLAVTDEQGVAPIVLPKFFIAFASFTSVPRSIM